MSLYILNAFSLNMLEGDANVSFRRISHSTVILKIEQHGFESAVGHFDTANLLSKDLGVGIACHRISVVLRPGDRAIVAQYSGPRLPEGATSLPEGATLSYWEVVSEG